MNYDKDLSTEKWTVKIDTKRNFGYFERCSDGAGGGLWFGFNDNQKLELIDYDGMSCLPKSMVKILRDAGYHLDSSYDPDPTESGEKDEQRKA